MDEIVAQAMAKWPDVPAAWGWLRLDRRGHWRLIDRNRPGFDEAVHGEGTRLEHAAFADAICRNYQADEQGRWFFQNGPQRVFVDLELAPLVFRVFEASAGDAGSLGGAGGAGGMSGAGGAGSAGSAGSSAGGAALVAHTGYPVAHVRGGLVDPQGNVFVDTDLGPGVVHDADLAALPLEDDAEGGPDALRLRLATGEAVLRRSAQDPAERFGFVRRPRP